MKKKSQQIRLKKASVKQLTETDLKKTVGGHAPPAIPQGGNSAGTYR